MTEPTPTVVDGRPAEEVRTSAPNEPTSPTSTRDDQAAREDEAQPESSGAESPTAADNERKEQRQYQTLGGLLNAHNLFDVIKKSQRPLEEHHLITPELRAIYSTVKGLAEAGALRDVREIVGDDKRKQAAFGNYTAVFEALRDQRFIPAAVADPAELVTRLNAAVPANDGFQVPDTDLRAAIAPTEAADSAQATRAKPQQATAAQTPPPDDSGATPEDGDTAPGQEEDEPTLYTYQRNLLPEHALIGSLIHAPNAINDLEKFLGPRDFSSQSVRAIYTTVRGLAVSRELIDVLSVQGDGPRKEAADKNRLAVVRALADQRFTQDTVPNASRLLAQMYRAAPAETLPYRGVYDEGAQMRLGRMVLEDSIRRHVEGLGVQMVRPAALTRPPLVQGRGTVEEMRSNLALVDASLDKLAQRLALAVERTGPAAHQSDIDPARVAQNEAKPYKPWRGWLTKAQVYRAERHLIHLALYSGTGLDIDLTPDDFSNRRHANTWAAIQRVQAAGETVNATSVFLAVKPADLARENHPRPVLSDKTILDMGTVEPKNDEARIGRSLRTVVTAGLRKFSGNSRDAVQAAARNRGVDPQALLNYAKDEVSKLTKRADTAGTQHQRATEMLGNRGATR
ncbi:DnaB-like helicase N-terminal domain-containing protein [Amycolatopsis anabasis]|uniref:DnaB-like helicase N-terminal domain-containing protein n=1 Tax=Amycolatopsis anabasis TaxID=1840409 RepID=UPI00131CD420|nr:DnaB-like helicase N-terminal domain-containing protein [Amycolatopsis anabasis]